MITYLILGMLAAVYMLINLALPHIAFNPLVKAYIVQPLLWGTLIAAVKFLPGYRPLGKSSKKIVFIQLALGLSFIQIFLYFIGGLFSGFGKSPSFFASWSIAEIVFFVGMMLVGIELSRAWLVTRFGKKHIFLVIFLATIIFTFISLPLTQITGFQLKIASLNQVISSWLPLFAENLAASYLVLVAGASASLSFRGLLAAFWWLCPILPNLDPVLKGLIGTVVPILGIIVINNYYSSQAAKVKSRKRMNNNSMPTGWIMTSIGCVAIIWFATGVLPVKPSIVPTGSMVPVINPGDVVLMASVQPAAIKLGDIIEYKNAKEKINIVHRVIEIDGSGQNLSFILKGDANNSADPDPVSSQAIMGREIFIIPKVGWISISVKNLFAGK